MKSLIAFIFGLILTLGGFSQTVEDTTGIAEINDLQNSRYDQYLRKCFPEFRTIVTLTNGDTMGVCSVESALMLGETKWTDSIAPLTRFLKKVSEYYNNNGTHIILTGGYRIFNIQDMIRQTKYGKILFFGVHTCLVSQSTISLTDSFNEVTSDYMKNMIVEFNFDSTKIYFKYSDITPFLEEHNKKFEDYSVLTTKRDTLTLDRYFLYRSQRTDSVSFDLDEELFTMIDKGIGKIMYNGRQITAHYHKKVNLKQENGSIWSKRIYYYDKQTNQHFLTRIVSQKMVSIKNPNF